SLNVPPSKTVWNRQTAFAESEPSITIDPPVLSRSPYSKTDQPLRWPPDEPIGGPARPVTLLMSPPVAPVLTNDMFEMRVRPGEFPARSCPPLMRMGAFGK